MQIKHEVVDGESVMLLKGIWLTSAMIDLIESMVIKNIWNFHAEVISKQPNQEMIIKFNQTALKSSIMEFEDFMTVTDLKECSPVIKAKNCDESTLVMAIAKDELGLPTVMVTDDLSEIVFYPRNNLQYNAIIQWLTELNVAYQESFIIADKIATNLAYQPIYT